MSSHSRTLRERSLPSSFAAVRIRQRIPWRRVVTIDSSTRFWIRTGRPAFQASAAVIGSIFV